MNGVRTRGRRIAKILGTFFLGQGTLQGVNFIEGLYLVRTMSIEAFAQFGLTVRFEQTVGLLMALALPAPSFPPCRSG